MKPSPVAQLAQVLRDMLLDPATAVEANRALAPVLSHARIALPWQQDGMFRQFRVDLQGNTVGTVELRFDITEAHIRAGTLEQRRPYAWTVASLEGVSQQGGFEVSQNGFEAHQYDALRNVEEVLEQWGFGVCSPTTPEGMSAFIKEITQT